MRSTGSMAEDEFRRTLVASNAALREARKRGGSGPGAVLIALGVDPATALVLR